MFFLSRARRVEWQASRRGLCVPRVCDSGRAGVEPSASRRNSGSPRLAEADTFEADEALLLFVQRWEGPELCCVAPPLLSAERRRFCACGVSSPGKFNWRFCRVLSERVVFLTTTSASWAQRTGAQGLVFGALPKALLREEATLQKRETGERSNRRVPPSPQNPRGRRLRLPR